MEVHQHCLLVSRCLSSRAARPLAAVYEFAIVPIILVDKRWPRNAWGLIVA